MEKLNPNIEMNIADAIMEKPIGFHIGNRHFCLYPPSLGKTYLLSRLIDGLSINKDILKENPFLESLRLCKDKKDIVCRIISYHTFRRKRDILDEVKVSSRAMIFEKELDDKELANLFIATTLWDNASTYIKLFGLDKEQMLRKKIAKLKEKSGGNVSFGGLSTYGALIDFACQRYGWTMEYVVWGISYLNLQMLMADAVTSIYLSKEEMKKLRIPQDRTFINGDDPSSMDRIKTMDWD